VPPLDVFAFVSILLYPLGPGIEEVVVRRPVLAVILLLSACGQASAQVFTEAPDTLWSRIHSISPYGDIDEGKCVRQTAGGGYIIAGAGVPNGMESAIDAQLVKTDSEGHIQWVRTFGREYVDEALSLDLIPEGGYVIGGRSLTITGPIPASFHQSDAWIIRTDADGDTLWTRLYGGHGHDYATCIRRTPDSGFVLTGAVNSIHSYPEFLTFQVTETDTSNVWLIRTDANGDTLWTRTYHEHSQGNCVAPTSDGGFVITGWVFSDDAEFQSDVLLIKTNASGDTLWSRSIGDSDFETGTCVRETDDGYVITGYTSPPESENCDALLIKTDCFGNVDWIKTYGGPSSDTGHSVEVTSDGGFLIAGARNGAHYFHIGEMWVFKTDGNGVLLWEATYRFHISNVAWCAVQTSDLGYVVSGLIGYGIGGDLWLAKLQPETSDVTDRRPPPWESGLGQNRPNPFGPSTTISYSVDTPGPVSLKIYDALGREVRHLVRGFHDPGTYHVDFDAGGLASGVYFYKLQAGDGIAETRKMLLAR